MMFVFPCNSISTGHNSSSSACLSTATDSPVKLACSHLSVAVLSSITLKSAGTLSPVCSATISPTTNSLAGTVIISPLLLITLASGDCISFNASNAFSAFVSCHTPTMAFKTKINRITKGSTNAVISFPPPGFGPSSKNARTNDTIAEASKILTNASSNCSKTNFSKLFPFALVSSFAPNLSCLFATSALDKPNSKDVS